MKAATVALDDAIATPARVAAASRAKSLWSSYAQRSSAKSDVMRRAIWM
jgi:hypothetical protein